MTKSWFLLWLATLATVPSWAQEDVTDASEREAAVERITGPVPEELEAFQATLARFEARVAEFEQHTLDAVAREKKRQFDRLTASYDDALAELDQREHDRRVSAMSRFESFLAKYPDIEYASEVRLRLAELYFQEAEESWLAEAESYFKALDDAGDDLDELMRLEELGEPTIDLAQVVSLLQRIIDDNRDRPIEEQYELLDVAYYMLAFCYEKPNSKNI